MNSSIYIDGIALYIFLALVVLITIGAIVLGNSNVKLLNETAELKAKNKELRRQLSYTQDKLYKATFKTPEVKNDEL